MIQCAIILTVALTTSSATTFETLFPTQNERYSYAFSINVTTGTLSPVEDGSSWTMDGVINIQVYDGFGRARFQIEELKTATHSKHLEAYYQSEEAASYLKTPWEINSCFTSMHAHTEPSWATNMKRALSFNFLLAPPLDSKDTHYTIQEPCLQGVCLAVYSWAGTKLRKYYSALQAGVVSSHGVFCSHTNNAWYTAAYQPYNPNYMTSSSREYDLQQTGLQGLEMRSSIQYRTENTLLAVITTMSLTLDDRKPASRIEKLNLTEASVHYATHSFDDPTNGIMVRGQEELKNMTYDMLLKIATKGIDADNIVRNASFIHSLDFIDLLTNNDVGTHLHLLSFQRMSQLDYTSLQQLFTLSLGTSYELETARSLLLEVLPYARSEHSARLVRHLLIHHKSKIEDATLVSLIRKLPFNLVDFNRPLLQELEVFTKLGLDFPQEIRHAGILSFATLVGKAMDASFDQQYFDDIYDKYLRMYNYFPQYLDRLVWLQGLTNIGQSVAHYLSEIRTDPHKDPHERLWTALASLSIWRDTSLSNVLPIITNSTEYINLRIVALHAFLSSSHTSKDFLNIHDYIAKCDSNRMKKFWYSTIKSLEKNRFYNRYRVASHYIPFVTNQLSNPGPEYWATNNYIISQEPSLDVQGPTFQLLTVGGDSGLPELIMIEFSTGGERPFNAALYIIAEGIPSYAFRRLQTLNGASFWSEELQEMLKSLKVPLLDGSKVHIDIVIKVYDKTVYATHLNHERFDQWDAADVKNTIEDFVRFGSHINQQMVYYPIQMEKQVPTEVGTPIRLDSTIVSFTSIRGNLTAPSTEDNISWINDLHIRYQGTAVTALSTWGPLHSSQHTARAQRSLVAHLPVKVDVGLSLAERALELKWTNPAQNGGIAMHSRTQITIDGRQGKFVHTVKTKKKLQEDDSIFFDCENPMSGSEITELLTPKSYSLLSSLHPSQIILNTLKLITSSTMGSCGVILPPRQLQRGNKFSVAVRVEGWRLDDEKYERMLMTKVGFVLKYYREAAEDIIADSFLTIQGTTELKTDGTSGNFSLQLNGELPHSEDHKLRNWTICLQESHKALLLHTSQKTKQNLPSETLQLKEEILLSLKPLSYKGSVHLNYSLAPDFSCFGKEPMANFNVDYNVITEDNVRKWRVSLTGKNPLSILDGLTIVEDFNLAKLQKKYNKSPNNDELLMPIAVDEKQGDMVISIDGREHEVKSGDLMMIPLSWNYLQTLTTLGVYQACRIGDGRVATFAHQAALLPEMYKDVLLAGDCTNASRFAVFLSTDTMTVYSGEETAVYLKKGFTAVNANSTNDSDFRISESGHLLRSAKFGLHIYRHHYSDEITILLPRLYLDTTCGLCSGQEYYSSQ